MDWAAVELIEFTGESEKLQPEPILAGLSASPGNLHEAFLSSLPHLAETQEAHSTVIDIASGIPEYHHSTLMALQPIDVAIAELGGYREDDALVLPLNDAVQAQVNLEISKGEDGTALRLNVHGNGEELTRIFRLPEGSELSQAGWRGSELILQFN
ncbi:MAG: hypothetical protein QF440_00530 [Candidatus Thalassarchaeaceae archaeon]|jgi:hypothetical protein|nr:hypothetical protein [Candidatus Thalassarchaeaceae archaeon]